MGVRMLVGWMVVVAAAGFLPQQVPRSFVPPGYPGAGTGRHFWIDAALGDDGNAGTWDAPWRSVDRVESVSFGPGDLVHVRAGQYELQGSLRLTGIQGTAGAWIGLVADGPVRLRNAALQNVVNVEDCRFLFLKGFEITHDNRGRGYAEWDPVDGVKFQNQDSHSVAVEDCVLHSLGGVGVASQAPLVTDVRVVGCEIRQCYTGLYWGYYEAANKNYAHDGLIAGNYIHRCPPIDLDGTGYGIQIKGGSHGNVIEDNVLVEVAGSTRAAIAVYHASTDQGPAPGRNVIRRNFIRASRAEGIYAAEGARIEDNLVYDCASVGINLAMRNTGGWGVFYGDLRVRHNTVYRVNSAGGQALFVGSGAFTGALVVANNLLAVEGAGQLSLRLPAGFLGRSAGNHCHGPTSGPTGGVITLADLGDLLSTTYGDADFLFPAPTGVLVGGGVANQATRRDFGLTIRDAAPDAGAFESTGAGNPGWTPQDGFKQ